jgi:hypothetical protein
MEMKALWPLQFGAVVFPAGGHPMNRVPLGKKKLSQFAPLIIFGCGV